MQLQRDVQYLSYYVEMFNVLGVNQQFIEGKEVKTCWKSSV